MMVLCWYVSNCTEALVGATLLRKYLGHPARFDSQRNVRVFILCGVFFAPFVSSFLDAGFIRLVGWGHDGYWGILRMRFWSNTLATLTIVPVITAAGSGGFSSLRNRNNKRLGEAFVLMVCLVAGGTLPFYEDSLPISVIPTLVYLPLPFLLWAAVRFGPAGMSGALLVTTVMAEWGVIHGLGPFSEMDPLLNAFSMQVFLFVLSVPLLFLTASIQERQNASMALNESEARFRIAADAAPVILWMSGPDKLTTFLSKGWLEFTGRPLDAELGNRWEERIHPEDLPSLIHTYHSSFDARATFEVEYRLRRHDGEYRWIVDRGVPRYGGNGNFSDISARLSISRRARKSRRRWRAVKNVTAKWWSPSGNWFAATCWTRR